MRAARYHGNSDVRIEEVPDPVIGPGEVGVAVAWCGICGTDLHEFISGPIFTPTPDKPNPTTGECGPVVIGHEFAGVIYQLGSGVEDLEIGDHVVVEPLIMPRDTPTGPGEAYNVADGITFYGMGGRGGGLAERVAVERRWVHKIDKRVPLDQAALIEPLSVAYHAIERAAVAPGEWALVTGAGPIGLLTAMALGHRGVHVIVTEPSPLRRNTAAGIVGPDRVIDPFREPVRARVMEITNDRGVDLGFECSSAQAAADDQMDSLRPRGRLVVASIWGGPVSFEMNKIVLKELAILGTIVYVNNHPEVVRLVEQGAFDLGSLITHRIGLDDLVPVGLDTLINRNDVAVKIVVSPSGHGL